MRLFQIGEMAKLFHLSVSSIRHYEDLGLILPEKTDENTGYRYYSTRQFEAFNTVRYLRALDMPLSEISDFMKDRDVDKIEQKLRAQKLSVEQKLLELRRVEKKIEKRLESLVDAKNSRLDEIYLSSLAPCRMFFTEKSLEIKDYRDIEGPTIRMAELESEAVIFLGKVGVGISAEHLAAGEFSKYDGIFLLLDDEDKFSEKVMTLPKTKCVSVRFRGSHTEAAEQYKKLMNYMNENGLSPSGFSREITLIDYGFTTDKEQYVTEISIPVTSRKA